MIDAYMEINLLTKRYTPTTQSAAALWVAGERNVSPLPTQIIVNGV
jgi:hypothetical protein